MAKKITCPVCFTNMNAVGHDLVCPTCGYKYCEGRTPYSYDDHSHNDYKSYNQKTSYSTGYVTSSTSQSASNSAYGQTSGAYSRTASSGQSSGAYSRPASSGQSSGAYSRPASSGQSTSTYASSSSQSAGSGRPASYAAQGTQDYVSQRYQFKQAQADQRYQSAQQGRKPKKSKSGIFIWLFIIFLIIRFVITNMGDNVPSKALQAFLERFFN